ncbi:hypothetical protein C0585_04345 [Candidatus Woesearchaeota archaeon]|nr:MAG: hypothetical protein C0585_04345 [Candidatus Woesearchaeota archaeon]
MKNKIIFFTISIFLVYSAFGALYAGNTEDRDCTDLGFNECDTSNECHLTGYWFWKKCVNTPDEDASSEENTETDNQNMQNQASTEDDNDDGDNDENNEETGNQNSANNENQETSKEFCDDTIIDFNIGEECVTDEICGFEKYCENCICKNSEEINNEEGLSIKIVEVIGDQIKLRIESN